MSFLVSPGILLAIIFGCTAILAVVVLVFYCWRTQKLQKIGQQISRHIGAEGFRARGNGKTSKNCVPGWKGEGDLSPM